MRDLIIESLKRRFESYDELTSETNDQMLGEKLEILKHKSLGEHLWCVVGARESYAKAIEAGAWEGFNCSLQDFSHSSFSQKVSSSGRDVLAAISRVSDWTKEREEFLMTLAEHEVMHEGQIIRHLYGLEVEIPKSVKWA
ncbi:MAG: hypothetical protein JKY88_02510 [Pseudomonadales bacterium]|nr:hypothetical protein [Pseudomonadales bacterium]